MLEEAQSFFEKESYKQAAELFEKILKENTNPLIILNLGRCY